jgi:hypothetical protein
LRSVELSALEVDAVRAGRYSGLIGHGGDGSKRFRRLGVGHRFAVAGVNTWKVLVLALAGLEYTVLGVTGDIVGATDTIINVFTIVSSVGTSRIASFDAELAATHEVVPFDHLLEVVLVAAITWECIRVHQSSEGVATQISTVRVKLATEIAFFDVDQSLVNKSDNADIVGGLNELDALEGALGNDAGPMPGLCAPGDFLAFGIGDGRVGLGRCPETKVIYTVHEGSLAKGLGAFGRGVTDVVTKLTASKEVVSVGLVRNTGWVRKMLGSEGSSWCSLRGRWRGRLC